MSVDNEAKRQRSAKAIVDLCGKLDVAIETFIESSAALGVERGEREGPLTRKRALADAQGTVLLLVKSAKLPGAKDRETQAKFGRPLRIGGISIMERIAS
ncbi:MAG: hypothetical protein ACREXP_10795 [Steroidobacteraceae bacterium]